VATFADVIIRGVARPYRPEKVLVVAELPRTASGKIGKFALRDTVRRLP
jgi:acyl-coenzyme A synthetase/AMP-(fatty) acid ligase